MASVYIDKDRPYRNSRITRAAAGEPCTVNGPTCNHDQDTSVWAHSPYAAHGKAGARKAHDHAGCIACSECHTWLDGVWTRQGGLARADVKAIFCDAMVKSLLILLRKGVLK